MYDITGYFLLAVLVVGIAYDILQYKKSDGVTITTWIRTMSHRHPLIPFLFGVLIGHFFFNE